MKIDSTGSLKNTLLNLGARKSDAVLDVGCGNGEFTSILALNAKTVVGIDPEESAVRSARKKYRRQNLLFQVGRAEALDFSSTSLDTVVFCQSLHHVPLNFQKKALDEAWHVLKADGRLLIIEPIYGKGSLEKIEGLYNDEKDERQSARNAVESRINDDFTLGLQKEIPIQETCTGFEDLFKNSIQPKSYAKWDPAYKDEIIIILDKCDKTPDGAIVMEYFATVWLLYKKI